jgi:lactoylglutathione lyase
MKLGYVILYVRDVEATVNFYEKAFGLKRRFVHESGYAEMETGETALAFAAEAAVAANGTDFTPVRPGSKPPAAEIALVSDDPKASYDRAIAAGATAVVEPAGKPWGQVVGYVRDMNGFLVEVCSPVSH